MIEKIKKITLNLFKILCANFCSGEGVLNIIEQRVSHEKERINQNTVLFYNYNDTDAYFAIFTLTKEVGKV